MAVLEELGSKLTDISGIKVTFPLPNDKDLILKVYSRLCLLYDETWDFDGASHSLSCKKILRLLNRVGIAHLAPTAADVTDTRRLPRVWSAFVAHLEQKYGGHGLYPRLRRVLKQQQILAARRDAERGRQQRIACPARSPGKSQLSDISGCSALSQDSQEIRFAKPHPPLQKAPFPRERSPASTASPTKACSRSRIPVPTRHNLIPSGKQLARTPNLPARGVLQTAALRGTLPVAQMFGSPVLVAPKAAATLAAANAAQPGLPGDRSDDVTLEATTSIGSSPDRRRPLLSVAKTPEQALGEYIESRLNAGFPRGSDVAAQTLPAPAATETTLNVTYSAERPGAAPRAAEKGSSPATDARDAILQAAGDADDKENVRPENVDEPVSAKLTGKSTEASSVRRDTFELPSGGVSERAVNAVESTAPPSEGEEGLRGGQESDGNTVIRAPTVDAKEPVATAEAAAAGVVPTTVDRWRPVLLVSDQAPDSSQTEPVNPSVTDDPLSGPVSGSALSEQADPSPSEIPAKKPRSRTKKRTKAEADAPKKRRARSKKIKENVDSAAVDVDEASACVVASTAEALECEVRLDTPEAAPNKVTEEQVQVTAEEAPKRRRGRSKKVNKEINDGGDNVTGVDDAACVPEKDPILSGRVGAADVELPQDLTTSAKELPKRRQRRPKKEDDPVTLSMLVNSDDVTAAEKAPSTAPLCEDHVKCDLEFTEAAKASGREASKKRRGRTKEAKLLATATDDATAAAGGASGPTAEPVEQAPPRRLSRRKVAARPQENMDAEATQPAVASEESAATEPRPTVARGRGRRTRRTAAELIETPAECSVETAAPAGGRSARASRSSCSVTDAAGTAGRRTPEPTSNGSEEPTAVGPTRTAAEGPAPRRRRLRVVLESDSEGDTPPAPEQRADTSASPAPIRRTRRGRKAKTGVENDRPRRALRSLENC